MSPTSAPWSSAELFVRPSASHQTSTCWLPTLRLIDRRITQLPQSIGLIRQMLRSISTTKSKTRPRRLRTIRVFLFPIKVLKCWGLQSMQNPYLRLCMKVAWPISTSQVSSETSTEVKSCKHLWQNRGQILARPNSSLFPLCALGSLFPAASVNFGMTMSSILSKDSNSLAFSSVNCASQLSS